MNVRLVSVFYVWPAGIAHSRKCDKSSFNRKTSINKIIHTWRFQIEKIIQLDSFFLVMLIICNWFSILPVKYDQLGNKINLHHTLPCWILVNVFILTNKKTTKCFSIHAQEQVQISWYCSSIRYWEFSTIVCLLQPWAIETFTKTGK